MVGKYVIGWLPLVVIGILNGILRQAGYSKLVGELTAHQISTVTGIVLMGLYIWWLTGKWRIESSGHPSSHYQLPSPAEKYFPADFHIVITLCYLERSL